MVEGVTISGGPSMTSMPKRSMVSERGARDLASPVRTWFVAETVEEDSEPGPCCGRRVGPPGLGSLKTQARREQRGRQLRRLQNIVVAVEASSASATDTGQLDVKLEGVKGYASGMEAEGEEQHAGEMRTP